MRRGRYIEMILVTIAVVVMTAVSTRVCAQEIAIEDTLINEEEVLAADTMVNNDPEWYVAPVDRAIIRAPKRAAAGTCPIDSVLTFNIDSVLTDVAIYEYGDTIRTITWAVNPDGSRIGKLKNEEVRSATNVLLMQASYTWDNTTNDWKGTSKEEHVYDGSRETSRTLYNTWLNNAWVADTKYTWVYNEAGRETEYTTYTRNTSTNQLMLSKQRIREWYNASKTTLDIQYTAHDGTNWSAGTKKQWTYDESGNTTEYFYYSSLSNGNWIGNTHEITGYTAGKKTSFEKYTWSNGNWVGSSREIWTFNNSGKQTLHEKYAYASDWYITLREIAGFDEAGRSILVENYGLSGTTWKGTKKEEYAYHNTTTKKTLTIKYKWTTDGWAYNNKSVNAYDAAGNTIETASYNWKNEAWVGTGTRTLQTFNSSKNVTEIITQSWSTALNNWENKTRNTTQYSGSRTTQEASYTWSSELNDWIGISRSDWHYNAAGQNDTIKTYTPNGTEWLFSGRTVNTYNEEGTNIMTHNATWQENAWVMTSMTRTDVIKDDAGRQILNAFWRCESDSIWIGVRKDTVSYGINNSIIYAATYTSWSNNEWVGSSKNEYAYDSIGNALLQQGFYWDNGQWVGQYRYEYAYDSLGHTISVATYDGWNASTQNWIGNDKTITVYNTSGQVSYSINYIWRGGDWTPYQKYLYSYDNQNRVTEQLIQLYSNDTWSSFLKYEKAYNGNTLIKDNSYSWNNNRWLINSRIEYMYDATSQTKLRREIIGSWNNGEVVSYTDKLYFYDCDHPHDYTIRFENEDGTLLASQQVAVGQIPSYDETPIKVADNEHEYTFTGWSPAVVEVTGDATYTAIYTATLRKYQITWLNDDNTQIDQTEVEYGVVPTHANPTKENTAEYTYEFTGWDVTPVAVTGTATYKATFSATLRKYMITWLNDDDTQIDQTEVEYGVVPTHANPTKENTAEYSYEFTGWDVEPVAVTGVATYKATFSVTKNKYQITWLNDDNTQIDQTEVEYGIVPTHANPTKENTPEYSYEFTGWDVEPVAVTGVATYKATFSATKNKYQITWLMDDGSVIDQAEVEYGSTPAHANINKESTAKYTYTFKGWSPAVSSVTGEASYIAQFDSVINKYTVTFYFEDGVTVIKSTEMAYGEVPSIDITPSRVAEEHYYYVFAGWSPELTEVMSDASYTAIFNKKPKEYEILFKDWNGTQLLKANVAYGTMPEYTGATPERRGNAHYSYTFTGWSPELTEVTGNATYTAVYETVVNMYTVRFLDEDGTELENQLVAYGVVPAYQGETPTKEDDEEYRYVFAGWSPRVTAVTSDAAYYATYTAHKKTEGFESITDHQSPITNKIMIDGRIYILRGGHTYTTDGTMVE